MSLDKSALNSLAIAQHYYRSLLALVKHVASMGETVVVVQNANKSKKEPWILYSDVNALDKLEGVEDG